MWDISYVVPCAESLRTVTVSARSETLLPVLLKLHVGDHVT